MKIEFHIGPFRLGQNTYPYGILIKWLGKYRVIGKAMRKVDDGEEETSSDD